MKDFYTAWYINGTLFTHTQTARHFHDVLTFILCVCACIHSFLGDTVRVFLHFKSCVALVFIPSSTWNQKKNGQIKYIYIVILLI